MKITFETPNLEVVEFANEDIICQSPGGGITIPDTDKVGSEGNLNLPIDPS